MQLSIQQAIELGVAHQRAGMAAQAEQLYRQILQHQPDQPDALNLLGVLLFQSGKLRDGMELIQRAVTVSPGTAEFHNNFGVISQAMGNLAEAEKQFRLAAQLKPDYAEAMNNLGAMVGERGALEESSQWAQRAVARNPQYADAFNNLGNALMRQGRVEEALAAYRDAVKAKPHLAPAWSNMLLTMHYQPDMSPREMFEQHAAWGKRLPEITGAAKARITHRNARNPNRRVRIGYLSGDFRVHSVAYFILSILEAHDRAQVEVFCYSDVARVDAFTETARRASDQWRSIVGWTDQQVTQQIRNDQIDVLIDLTGHTSGNRLGALTHKPAPVQVTYLGYPNTTGLTAIDYRLTDSFADPAGESDSLSVEKLVRLDPCAWCYRPHPGAPDVAPLPADVTDAVTFGSFNAIAKVNDRVIATWAKILQALPAARLLLKTGALGEEATKKRVADRFVPHGIDRSRLGLIGHVPNPADHLATYAKMDIALDTFPYNGTTTTCEAMWMGVPVVALSGQAHPGRVGVSLLTNANLPELIATSEDEYVRLAVQLAQDRNRLRDLRQGLRQRMLQSSLMDAPAMARRLEAAYRAMWQHWCHDSLASGD